MQQQNQIISYKQGRYIRYEQIGKGLGGEVYKGRDNQNNIDVAIKIQKTIDEGELELLNKFKEHQFMAFNNVVNVHEIIKEHNQIIIIMDYAKGGDLLNYQQTIDKQSQESTKEIMLQIANGVRELHQLNFVHRDLKPENILVAYNQDGKPCFKIADFGFSSSEKITSTIIYGTPYYMAPELINDNQNGLNQKIKFRFGFEVDIWALGCVYYEISTGDILFNSNSREELLNKIKATEQSWINTQIDQLSKYNIIERERKLLKLMISINPKMRPKIFEVVQTLFGSDEYIKPKIIPPNPNQIMAPNQQPPQRCTQTPNQILAPNQQLPQIAFQKPNQVISPYQQAPLNIPQKPNQMIAPNQQPTQIYPQKPNQIIIPNQQPLQISSQTPNQTKTPNQQATQIYPQPNQIIIPNPYFTLILSNYRQKLDKVIEIVTQTLSQININLTELQQIQQKTNEVNSLIQTLNNSTQQYEGQLSKYKELKQKQFDQTQLAQIQIESDEVMKQQFQIEAESKSLQSHLCEQFKIHLIHTIDASKIKLNNEYILLQEYVKQKKLKMNEIFTTMIKENRTIKTQDECEIILKKIINEENIENDFKQFINAVDEIHKQNTQQLKSFQDIDKDLSVVDQQIKNMQEYAINLKASEEKDIEKFEADIKFTPKNQNNYLNNQVKVGVKISDETIVRKVLQMKDQNMQNQDLIEEIMKFYEQIKKEENIQKNLQNIQI